MSAPSASDVAYLWRRAAFGISPRNAARRAGRPWSALVDEAFDPTPAPMPRPPELDDPNVADWERVYRTVNAWIAHMASTPTPGIEKLVWFWHGVFTTSADKVGYGTTIYNQLYMLRYRGPGPVRNLVRAELTNPGMMLYLDNVYNAAGNINENFGRELLELFTLGIGHYTQNDVRDVARSMTGQGVDWNNNLVAQYDAQAHDNGKKTVLGHTGNWGPNDILAILMDDATQRLRVARHLATRLFSQWAYPNPPFAVVRKIADDALAHGFTGRSLARAVLMHPEFRSDAARRAHIRTPLEIAVALLKATKSTPDDLNIQWTLRSVGHCPYFPPNVSGWPTSRMLLNTSTWWQLGALHEQAAWAAAQETPLRMPDTRSYSPADAAARILRYALLTEPSAALISDVADVITQLRPQTGPESERAGAHLAATLSPHFARG